MDAQLSAVIDRAHLDEDLDVPGTAASAVAPEMSKLSVLVAVVRRCGPHLIEATLIPTALFYGCLMLTGVGIALVTALLWTYSAMARRLLCHQAVPPILVLGVIGITVRTLVALASGSTFIYFVQPILGTLATAGVFLGSILIGRPLIGRLALEFWPVPPDVASRPAVLRLFRRLTFLWAGVNLATATTTFILLSTLPLATFVAAKQISGLAITGAGITLTIAASLRTARREGLVAPLSPRQSARLAI
jgi:hypothetical protein